VTLPFGKYKGLDIQDVPVKYLSWLVTSSRDTIRMAATELERRGLKVPSLRLKRDASWAEKIIDVGHRELAKRHHPDIPGGNTSDMQSINAAAEMLREKIR